MTIESPLTPSENPNRSDLKALTNLVVGDRYVLQNSIGEGGWSAVYLAFDRVLHRDVAVKIMHRPLASNPDNLQRFEREARTAGTLNHPNIAAIYDYGMLPSGQPYIVMEFLKGKTLAQRIEKRTVISQAQALEIVSQIAKALSHAHEKNILHRDIKPSNVIVLEDNSEEDSQKLRVKLLDFGLATWLEDDRISTLTDSGVALGTPSYMSPEQCRRSKVDCRSDIYSLGCTMYELLAGAKPFQGSTVDCLHAHLLETPSPFSKFENTICRSPAVESVVRKAMAKNPDRRMSSADAFLKELDAAANAKGNILQPLLWSISHSLSEHRKVWISLAASIAIVLTASYAAPQLLSLIGVRTVEINANEVDKEFLDEIVSDMAKSGNLSATGNSKPVSSAGHASKPDSP
ncbi:MAG: hypothetical protein C0507_13230 [Cyanobacteria bacterium PR.3.49]|nr:hypothetical protein [Cyanobacteria bacterium PR.3.49]